jgi:small subunit ribosomal protein S6
LRSALCEGGEIQRNIGPKLQPDNWDHFLTIKIFMATNNLQSYELMVIFTPVLAEDDFRNEQKKFQDFITENGGKIVNSNPWGLRSMAYPIDKKTTGLYWLLEYQAPADLNHKMEIQMNRDENVMRHMVTRLDKYAVIYNGRKRNKNTETESAS